MPLTDALTRTEGDHLRGQVELGAQLPRRAPDPEAIRRAIEAHEHFKQAAAEYEVAIAQGRDAFAAALDAGCTLRGLAAEVGLSAAMIQRLTR